MIVEEPVPRLSGRQESGTFAYADPGVHRQESIKTISDVRDESPRRDALVRRLERGSTAEEWPTFTCLDAVIAEGEIGRAHV